MDKLKTNIEIEVNPSLINNAIQKAVANSYRDLDMEGKILKYAREHLYNTLNKWINNGTLTERIAKQVAKEIDMTALLLLVDVEDLKERIVNRVSQHLIDKVKISV